MTVYLDSSAVLRVLLRQAKRLAAWGRWHAAYSSELLGVEARRVIDRLRLQAALDDDNLADAHHGLARIERSIGAVPVTRPVLHRAGCPCPPPSGLSTRSTSRARCYCASGGSRRSCSSPTIHSRGGRLEPSGSSASGYEGTVTPAIGRRRLPIRIAMSMNLLRFRTVVRRRSSAHRLAWQGDADTDHGAMVHMKRQARSTRACHRSRFSSYFLASSDGWRRLRSRWASCFPKAFCTSGGASM